MSSSDSLGKGSRYIDDLELGTSLNLVTQRHGVGNNETREDRAVDGVNGLATQNTVSDDGIDFTGTVLVDGLSSLGKSSTSVCHVINQDGDLVLDVTNEHHATNDVGARTLLVNKSESSVQAVSKRGSTLGATSVGGNDHAVFHVKVLSDPTKDGGLCVKVVDWDIEEALNLRSMEVHGDDMVASRNLEHVCDQFGTDRSSRLVLLVLARVRKAGDNSSDTSGRSSSTSVDHDEKLHQSIVDISRSSRLEDKDVLITDGLADRNTSLTVGVVEAHSVGDFNAESTSDFGTDFGVGAPRDEFDFVRHLIQHCRGRERKRAGRRIFGGEE
jgi:hypothetical protein